MDLAEVAPREEFKQRTRETAEEAGEWRIKDVGEWLRQHNIAVAYEKHTGAKQEIKVYVLAQCPFSPNKPSHNEKFYVTQHLEHGGLSAKCWKAQCQGHKITFSDYRALVEPGWYELWQARTSGFFNDGHSVMYRRAPGELPELVCQPPVTVTMLTRTENSGFCCINFVNHNP